MRLCVRSKTLNVGVERRAFGHRKALERTSDLDSKIEMALRCVVFVDNEQSCSCYARLSFCNAEGLRRGRWVALIAIAGKAIDHARTITQPRLSLTQIGRELFSRAAIE